MRKKTVLLLFIANCLLLGASWVMFFYAYPRLPSKMPLWLNFFGQKAMIAKKSLFFAVYPLAQTFVFLFFVIAGKKDTGKNFLLGTTALPLEDETEILLSELNKEFLYLTLIFFNLIFIHIQRTLILMAHQRAQGIDTYYFIVSIAVILILIPYYRIRAKLIIKDKGKAGEK